MDLRAFHISPLSFAFHLICIKMAVLCVTLQLFYGLKMNLYSTCNQRRPMKFLLDFEKYVLASCPKGLASHKSHKPKQQGVS